MKLASIPAILLFHALPAGAANVLVNGSFESTTVSITPTTTSGAFGDSAAFAGLTGWTHVMDTSGRLANGDTQNSDPAGPPYYVGNGTTIPYRYPTNGGTYVATGAGNFVLSQSITVAGAGTMTVAYDTIRLFLSGAGTLTFRFELFDGADATAPSLYDVTYECSGPSSGNLGKHHLRNPEQHRHPVVCENYGCRQWSLIPNWSGQPDR